VEENGVKKNKALIALARKLLRVSFALVRDKTEFISSCEEKTKIKKVA